MYLTTNSCLEKALLAVSLSIFSALTYLAIVVYKDAVKQSRASFLYILNILLAASAGLLFALVLFLYIPAILKIRTERKDVLRIFLSVPKSAITSICESLVEKDETKDIEDEALADDFEDTTVFLEHEGGTVPILGKLNIRYGGSLGK
jgi:hypothetical protein